MHNNIHVYIHTVCISMLLFCTSAWSVVPSVMHGGGTAIMWKSRLLLLLQDVTFPNERMLIQRCLCAQPRGGSRDGGGAAERLQEAGQRPLSGGPGGCAGSAARCQPRNWFPPLGSRFSGSPMCFLAGGRPQCILALLGVEGCLFRSHGLCGAHRWIRPVRLLFIGSVLLHGNMV